MPLPLMSLRSQVSSVYLRNSLLSCTFSCYQDSLFPAPCRLPCPLKCSRPLSVSCDLLLLMHVSYLYVPLNYGTWPLNMCLSSLMQPKHSLRAWPLSIYCRGLSCKLFFTSALVIPRTYTIPARIWGTTLNS